MIAMTVLLEISFAINVVEKDIFHVLVGLKSARGYP